MLEPNIPTFYWHDYETFGLRSLSDRPVQFAGLRTTMDFEPVGDPDLWYARPSIDYLPQPESCLITGITPQEALAKGLPEADFAARIFERFNTPGTLVVGYNNLRFDDNVTRALFWRNLFDLYSHQFKNGCSRWDLFPFVLAVWALRDEGIVWPLRETNDPAKASLVSFRLEKLTQANGIEHSHAHDAGSDVSATAALAKFLAHKVPRLWQWALANRDKTCVVRALNTGKPALWVTASAGQTAGYLRFPMPLAVNPANKNEYVVWDCRADPTELLDLSVEEIARRAFGSKAELKEGESRLSLFKLKVNTSPFVCADLRVAGARVCERFNLDLPTILANGEKLAKVANLLEGPVLEALRIAQASRGIDETEAMERDAAAARDVDFSLYEGFVNESDKNLMREVHALSPNAMAERAREGRIHFADPRINELFLRMRARSWPETLSNEERTAYQAHCRAVLEGRVSGYTGIEAYFEEIDARANDVAEALEAGRVTPEKAEARENVLNALYDWGEYVAGCVEGLSENLNENADEKEA